MLREATQPDIALDVTLAQWSGWTGLTTNPQRDGNLCLQGHKPGDPYLSMLPHYSGLFELAVQALPKGWSLSLVSNCKGRWSANLYRCGSTPSFMAQSEPLAQDATKTNPALAIWTAWFNVPLEDMIPGRV